MGYGRWLIKDDTMRIWDEKLIPYLCDIHLRSMWHEGWTIYSVITNNLKGWRNHPQTLVFENCPEKLWHILYLVRKEMLSRGFNPMKMKKRVCYGGNVEEWQTLEEQIEILKSKKCKCKIEFFDYQN